MLKRKDINLLQRLCLNHLYGKTHFLYSEIDTDDLKTAYKNLVTLESKLFVLGIERFKALPRAKQKECFDKIRENLINITEVI